MKKANLFFALAAIVSVCCSSCVKNLELCMLEVNSEDPVKGSASGGGVYHQGDEVTILATANPGYRFWQWNDGNSENPRTVTVEGNATYTASFNGSGRSVTFGNYTWSNVFYVSTYWPSYSVMATSLYSNTNYSYPYAYIRIDSPANVTRTLTAGADGYLSGNYNCIEYYQQTSLISVNNGDTIYYGDWWAKSATVTISMLDFTAKKMNLKVNATMFDANYAFITPATGMASAPTRTLTVELPNLTFSQAKQVVESVARMNSAPRWQIIDTGSLQVMQ